MTYYGPLLYEVTEAEAGWTVRAVLRNRLGVSRKLMSSLKMTEQGIMLNGERVYVDRHVKPGDRVEIRMKQEESDDIVPQPIPFGILYEDDALLIVNKPAGLIVHPTHGHYVNTLANGVVHHWKEQGEQRRFRPIHRLDQDTSGVLAVAKTPHAHQQVAAQMLRDETEKAYVAFVHGRPPFESGTVEGAIDRDPITPHIRIVTEAGMPSATHYATAKLYRGAALVRLRLETGRTHQIRVHMRHIGCPLIGDPLYGEPELDRSLGVELGRQALHAERLSIDHPVTGRRMTFEAPWPDDLLQLERRLIPNTEGA